ncbi:phosphatase PAP2 family protein [Streptomyces beijiangensis]|uniref:Phosphatase PAP2 family protein n=1 Tax=Streptomyces beijiangensis TaxID=163361 RepID=A0A939FDS4_9ACTN|nr:phosphatase PAP2 family protein [Streptomyces beijiangensis]MBO0516341.1 phosphatase PAP2 family protein [Streptomyces beijiangensis]
MSTFDGGLYTRITDLAQHAPHWLDNVITFWSNYGLALFAVLMLVAWWRARNDSAERMATALAVPVIVVVAYLANDVIKMLFHEQRPCQTLHTVTLDTCPALGDWSFPSNHSAIAGAAAVALFIAYRRLAVIAIPAALLMAASRVWVGVHYPHDVVIGLLTGILVAWPLALLARRAAPAVDRLRDTRLKPLLVATG